MSKLSNLLNKELKIVEKRKITFIVPAIIVLLAVILMIIYHFTLGSALNLGMDFTGGYTVNVKLSTKLTDSTYESYKNDIVKIVENLKDEKGKSYGIKISDIQRQGSGDSASVYVKYKAVADEATMTDEINPAIKEALETSIFKFVPQVSYSNGKYVLRYGTVLIDSVVNDLKEKINTIATSEGVTISDVAVSANNTDLEITTAENASLKDIFVSQLSIDDKYSGQVVQGDTIGATVSKELLINAILAVSVAIVLMLVYIAFRFEVSSGLSAICALFHDIIVMFCAMAIFRIEINSTFIAALITILGYSINNTIIVFDRIRENAKSLFNKNSTATFIANTSVRETLIRSINTTITTLITIGAVAIIGVPDIRIFALPIIIGLLAGAYSSIFISPAIWAMWKDRKKKNNKINKADAKKAKEAVTA